MWALVSRSTREGIQIHDIKAGVTSIGRVSSNTIPIPDPLVSRFHCELEVDPETQELSLHDLGSKNGTYVNGKPITTVQVLQADDQIRIGHKVFEIHQRGAKTRFAEEKGRLRTRPLSGELVRQSIDRHTLLLNEISEHLNTVPDLDAAIEQVTTLTKKVLGADRSIVILASGFDQLKKMGIPRTITRPAIEDQLIVHIVGIDEHPKLGKTGLLQGVHSALCVPVPVNQEVAAIFYLDKSTASSPPFPERELELAVGISHQLALAIQRKEMETRLAKKAQYDPLTSLPNQNLFVSFLEKAAGQEKQNPEFGFMVITLDLDDFKLVNDFYGYALGDEVLLLLARRLSEFLPAEASIARMEGDAFAILVPGVKDGEEAARFAHNLHKTITKSIILNDRQINLSAGVGISLSSVGYDKPVDLLRNADTAMYRAKEKGKAQSAVFNENMRERSIARLNLESKLSRAIANDEFRVQYQPIVSLENAAIIGFEALVRWQQAKNFLISASDFIPLAEETHVIYDIDMFVLQTASDQLKEWKNKFQIAVPLWVSVNLSSRHISNRSLIGTLQQIIKETGLEPHSLNLEFTEKTLMEENSETIIVLNKLREMGIQLSIDDFGTGYSSLSYLRHFPVNYIKLDRSFIFEGDWEIANLITDLAHKLDLDVVAEGVENEEQFKRLQELTCDYAQGNYFSSDVDAKQVGLMLKTIQDQSAAN